MPTSKRSDRHGEADDDRTPCNYQVGFTTGMNVERSLTLRSEEIDVLNGADVDAIEFGWQTIARKIL